LVAKPEGMRPLGRPTCRQMDRVGRYGLHSSGSGQGPVVGSCEQSNELLGSIKHGEFLE